MGRDAGLDIVILGLSITSSWGNGHATTYRALVKGLSRLGHRVLFLEHDKPWYAAHRDMPTLPWQSASCQLYSSLDELRARFAEPIAKADFVMVGSYVPEGVATAELALAMAGGPVGFYDIDTPVTLANLSANTCEYLTPQLVGRFSIYLSFTGGPVLRRIERELGAPMTRPLYCSVDPDIYQPCDQPAQWDLGYLGTYAADRQPTLDKLLLAPARRWPAGQFVVAGPQYPQQIEWPANVMRIDHLPPADHRDFYCRQRFTLNVTRADMVRTGYSPSVRLFEAAACGVPIVCDHWPGLEQFFEPERELLVAESADDVLTWLTVLGDAERQAIGRRARERVLAEHTCDHRAAELERYIRQVSRVLAP